jgi:hypothetical protein
MDVGPKRTPEHPRWALTRVRVWLFAGVGLALPFYAFPVARPFGKPIDIATVFAALFVAVSLLSRGWSHLEPRIRLLFAGGVLTPLLVLIPPRPVPFHVNAFATAYVHWLVVFSFFCLAASFQLMPSSQRMTAILIAILGTAVAVYALYQAVGIPRGWPGTGQLLVNFQREPLRFSWIGRYARPMSIFLEPAWLGGYLAWVSVLTADTAAGARKTRERFLGAVAVGVMVLAALATVSWGAYVNFGVVFVVSLATLARRGSSINRRPVAFLAACLAILVVASLATPAREVVRAVVARASWLIGEPFESARLNPQAIDSTSLRVLNLIHTAKLFQEHPWRGVGLGQFRFYERDDPRLLYPISLNPWCGWLAIGAMLGLFGPLLLVFTIAVVAWHWWKGDEQRALRFTVPALLALAVVQQVHTASFIDLWWWYPLSLSAAISSSGANVREP